MICHDCTGCETAGTGVKPCISSGKTEEQGCRSFDSSVPILNLDLNRSDVDTRSILCIFDSNGALVEKNKQLCPHCGRIQKPHCR